jgi:hypothetical protein
MKLVFSCAFDRRGNHFGQTERKDVRGTFQKGNRDLTAGSVAVRVEFIRIAGSATRLGRSALGHAELRDDSIAALAGL